MNNNLKTISSSNDSSDFIINPSAAGIQINEPELPVNKQLPIEKLINDPDLFLKYAKTKVIDSTTNTLVSQDISLRNKITTKNVKLVSYVITSFYSYKEELLPLRDDLFQEGIFGLIKAIERFDITKGFQFSTYATWWIRHAISNYIASKDPQISIPGHVMTAQNKVIRKLKECPNLSFSDITPENTELFGLSKKMLENVSMSIKVKKLKSLEEPKNQTESEARIASSTYNFANRFSNKKFKKPTKEMKDSILKKSYSRKEQGWGGMEEIPAGNGGFLNGVHLEHVSSLKETIEDEALSIEQLMEQEEFIKIVVNSLNLLSPKYRNLILLRYKTIAEPSINENNSVNLSSNQDELPESLLTEEKE